MTYEFWILLTGALVGGTCGMMGCFLILRKMAMLADAISHTVLLGLVLAFLISQSLNGGIMLVGAAAAGLFTTYLIQVLNAKGIQEDASIGVVFTTLFAIGVILISLFAQNVHLDVEHALMGEIAFIPWDTLTLPMFGEVPKSVVMLTAVLLLDLVVVLLLFKEFKLTSFDPGMAAAMGFPILLLHYVMMTLVSVTTVSAFDSVGAILVVAMLIAPGATAYLWTDRYLKMILLSVIIGVFDSIAGYYAAKWLDVSISGSMAVVAGLVFLLTWILSPRHGLMARFSVLRAGRG